jgi:dynein light chain LC8-type
MADRKAVVKNADMSEDMQQDAIDIATQALEKFNIEKDIAAFIKKEFDKKYNPTWHCIVGKLTIHVSATAVISDPAFF